MEQVFYFCTGMTPSMGHNTTARLQAQSAFLLHSGTAKPYITIDYSNTQPSTLPAFQQQFHNNGIGRGCAFRP